MKLSVDPRFRQVRTPARDCVRRFVNRCSSNRIESIKKAPFPQQDRRPKKYRTFDRVIKTGSCLALALSAFFCANVALAEWDGGIEGGSTISDSGSSTRLRLKLTNLDRPLSQYIYADWIRSDSGQNSYEVGYKPRYWFTDQLYLFGEGRLGVDKPLLIERDVFILGGAGYQLFYTQQSSLWAELGVGARTTKFENNTDADDTLTLVRAGYHQILGELLRLELEGDIYSGEETVESTAEAGLSIRIPGGSLKYSYRVRQRKPDGGTTSRTSDSYLSFGYGF